MLLNDGFLNYMLSIYTDAIDRIDFYSGPIPSTGDTSPTGTLLARASQWFPGVHTELGFVPGVFRFEVLHPGVASTYAVSSAVNTGDRVDGNIQSPPAFSTGTIGYAQLHSGGSPDLSMYCSVGTSNAEIILDSLNIIAGDSVGIVSLKLTLPPSV